MKSKDTAARQFLMAALGIWVLGCGATTVFGAGEGKGNSHPLGLNENHPYGRLTSEYVTPHVTWGNPYFSGKLRALVLAPTWSQRETVELAQRLALDYTPWMPQTFTEIVEPTSSDEAFRFFQPPPEVVGRALQDAMQKDYDVIIVGKLNWAMLPARQRLQILEKVAAGAGLVYVNPAQPHKELDIVMGDEANGTGGREFILSGVPVANLPAFRVIPADKLVRAAPFGKGRVVLLDYAEQVPTKMWDATAYPCLTPAWDTTSYSKSDAGPAPLDKLPEVQLVPYEYYQSLVAKAVVWAAGKDSPIQVQMDLPASLPWPAGNKAVAVTVTNASDKVVLKATVRDRHDRTRVYPLSAQERRRDGAVFTLAELPCGEYFLDVWVLAPGGKATQTWSSRFFTVTDEFVFGELSLKNVLIESGDKVEGILTLPRTLKADERLFLDFSDNFGRRILTQEVASPAMSMAFTMTLPPPLTTLHRIEARLLRGSQTVVLKSISFPVRGHRRWDDFNEVSWGGGGGNGIICQRSAEKLVHDDEVDAFNIGWGGAATARNVALADGLMVPYQARYGCFGGPPSHILNPDIDARGCMSHPVTLKQLAEWGEKQSAIFGPYGPLAWTHGDETFYASDPDVCWCEFCLEVYHNYLQGVYPDLAALNAEWKTSYANWKEVKPVTFKEARETKNYAPWVEHCFANDRIFAGFYRKSSEALAAHDPGNRAGFDAFSALWWPNGGADWWHLSRTVGILQDYMHNEESTELIRSFGRPDQLRAMWYGTYGLTWPIGPNTVPFCHFFPWQSLFHGMNSTWFWTMGSPGPLSGYAPDLTSLPFFASRTAALQEIKAGLGKLLLNSRRDNDRIAVHFSELSRIVDALYADDGDRGKTYMPALADINRALEYAGLQYQYLSYEQVAQGELIKQGYKVFYMPHSRSVSDAECQAIREFVKKGGVVIADILPAILNGHGTPQSKSLLADLFPSEKPGDINAVGQGKTVVIGDMIKGLGHEAYDNRAGWKKMGDGSRQFADLLARVAELKPAVQIVHRGEGKMPPTEISRFQNGSIQFVGLLRSYWMYDNNAYPAAITFPTESHVYDVINGKYLGLKKEITGEISYRAQLYALSPYRVRAVQIQGPGKCIAGDRAAFTFEVRPAGKAVASQHLIRVEVTDPDGRNLPYYAANVLAENGSAEVTIPWALNDRPGIYTITARDVMSGVKSELRLKLTEAK